MLSKLSSCEIYGHLQKRKKRLCPFSSKSRPKNGKEAFSCELAADLASSDKSSFYSHDKWLQEIKEHECKPDKSEKQLVEISASHSKIRLEEAEEEQEDVGSWIISYKPIKQQLRVHKPAICIVANVRQRRAVSCCSRPLSCLWHLYKSLEDVFIAVCNLNYLWSQPVKWFGVY